MKRTVEDVVVLIYRLTTKITYQRVSYGHHLLGPPSTSDGMCEYPSLRPMGDIP